MVCFICDFALVNINTGR